MKNRRLVALCSILVALSCSGTPSSPEVASQWAGELHAHGTLREALRDGRTEARVDLATLARPGTWAVGALEGLRGEVTIEDGEVWVSEGGPEPRTLRAPLGEAATVLFAAEVDAWIELEVPADVGPEAFEDFVAAQARELGIDVTRPFPFTVRGQLRELRLHVIAGECPVRARALGREPRPAPFELVAESVPGRLVGIFAPAHTGVVCHHGSRVHVHAILEDDGGLTGHVEDVGLARGATLSLPLR